jgi:hypothetical protein
MANEFGEYSPEVPLGTTWREVFRFLDDAGAPVDLTGFVVRSQVRAAEVLRDPDTGLGDSDPLMELITDASLYSPAPAWPLHEAFELGLDEDTPDPTDGYIRQRVEAADTWALSPTNVLALLFWDIELVDPDDTNCVIPLVEGRPCTLPRHTLPIP